MKKKAPPNQTIYAPILATISKRIERALRGLDGVTFDLTLESAYWPDQPCKFHERLWVNLWFFREFKKSVSCAFGNFDVQSIRAQACATLVIMRAYFSGKKGGKKRG